MVGNLIHFNFGYFLNLKEKKIFGISQGRLTESDQLQRFPYEAWQKEFSNASLIGLSFIELLTERDFNKNNPVWTSQGRHEILSLCSETGCEIYTLCIDYIIDHSLLDDNDMSTHQHILNVFAAAKDLECKRLIFPLLEKSELSTNNLEKYATLFRELSDIAKKFNIDILIESMLKSDDLLNFLSLIDRKNIGAVFDTGNRVIESSDLYHEILKLGSYIKHVHIKDKNLNGKNVILGTGLVNFKDIFGALHKIDYKGRLNFETTRGTNPLETAEFHINFCKFFLREAQNKI